MTNTIRHHATQRKPFSLIGMRPAPDLVSYDAVPWYRRQWFALFPLMLPLVVVIAVTGDVYAKANRSMRRYDADTAVWRYTATSRAFFVIVAVGIMVQLGIRIWS